MCNHLTFHVFYLLLIHKITIQDGVNEQHFLFVLILFPPVHHIFDHILYVCSC